MHNIPGSILFWLGYGFKLLVVLAVFMLISALLPAERMLDLIGPPGRTGSTFDGYDPAYSASPL